MCKYFYRVHYSVSFRKIYIKSKETHIYIYIYIYFYSQSDSPLTKSGAEQRWREQELKTLSQRRIIGKHLLGQFFISLFILLPGVCECVVNVWL